MRVCFVFKPGAWISWVCVGTRCVMHATETLCLAVLLTQRLKVMGLYIVARGTDVSSVSVVNMHIIKLVRTDQKKIVAHWYSGQTRWLVWCGEAGGRLLVW